jgi:hypothetical protein
MGLDRPLELAEFLDNLHMNVVMSSALRIRRLFPPQKTPLALISFRCRFDARKTEFNPKEPTRKFYYSVRLLGRQRRWICGHLTCAIDTNMYRILVLTICRLWDAGVARWCRLHVPTFLFLDVHIVVWVFSEGSRSRWYLRRQVACSVPLVADSVTQELYLYTKVKQSL